MTAPVFATVDVFPHEGLYIFERNPPATVAGVINNTVGIAGTTVKGPVNTPTVVTSEARFREVFGGRDTIAGGPLTSEVFKALLNKQFGRLIIVRATAAAITTAERDFVDGVPTPIVNIAANSPGTHGNAITATIAAASDGDSAKFNLTVKDGREREQVFENLNVDGTNDNLLKVIGDDAGNLVVVTKLSSGRPIDIADQLLADTVAVDGTIADTDFTATDGPIDTLASFSNIGIAFVAGRSNSVIRTALGTKAAASSDRVFLVTSDNDGVSQAAAITDVAAGTRSDRLIYCFNYAKTLDPETATLISTEPHAWMASILGQTDPDVHPGVIDNATFLSGIKSLKVESNLDIDGFRAAGICTIEFDLVFTFVSGITTSVVAGKLEITRRRMVDFLQQGIANFLKSTTKQPNTPSRRIAAKGTVSAFLRDLFSQERFVDSTPDGKPAFEVDTEKLNSVASRNAGTEKMLVRVKLIPFKLFVVLETEMGFTVSVTEIS